jgi:riboflavin synthase alpha subunit
MLLQPVARGSRRCSEKKKWEDASRVEINTAKQIAGRFRGHVTVGHRSMHHTSSRLMHVRSKIWLRPR